MLTSLERVNALLGKEGLEPRLARTGKVNVDAEMLDLGWRRVGREHVLVLEHGRAIQVADMGDCYIVYRATGDRGLVS